MEMHENDVTRDSKAAYLCVKCTLGEDILSKDELLKALSYAGFSPTPVCINQYWTDSTESIPFSKFCDIVEKEPLPKEDELCSVFESCGLKDDKLYVEDILRIAELDGLSVEELRLLFGGATEIQDCKVSYKELCRDIIKTIDETKKLSVLKMEREEARKKVNTKTFVVKKKDENKLHIVAPNGIFPRLPRPKDVHEWHIAVTKGTFYLEDGAFICHQYSLEVRGLTTTTIWLTITPMNEDITPLVDTMIFVMKEVANKQKLLKAVTVSRDVEGTYFLLCDLPPGQYFLVPYTSGIRLKPRTSQPDEERILVQRDASEQLTLTDDFREVLDTIFDNIDLNNNGLVSKQEFNLFNWRTAGEEIQDEEWEVVEENFELVENQLTKAGFLNLHQMEVEDYNGDSSELWVALNAMGFNKALVQDEACPFYLSVFSKTNTIRLQVNGITSGGEATSAAVLKCIMDGGRATTIKDQKHLTLYQFHTALFEWFAIQNQSSITEKIQLDCSSSTGCTSKTGSLIWTGKVPAHSSEVVFQLMPIADDKEWHVRCEANMSDEVDEVDEVEESAERSEMS